MPGASTWVKRSLGQILSQAAHSPGGEANTVTCNLQNSTEHLLFMLMDVEAWRRDPELNLGGQGRLPVGEVTRMVFLSIIIPAFVSMC